MWLTLAEREIPNCEIQKQTINSNTFDKVKISHQTAERFGTFGSLKLDRQRYLTEMALGMLKFKYLALIGSLLLLTTCQTPAPTLSESKPTSRPAIVQSSRQENWHKNLARWLTLAYSENEHGASFAAISSKAIDHPDLYATYSAVGIYHTLGEPIAAKDEIREWLVSLQAENGAYVDSNHLIKYSALLETSWAVATLGDLDLPAPRSEKTISFLRSLQTQDGFFQPDQDIGGNPLSQKIVATFWTIDALARLKIDLAKQDFLVPTKRALADYLNTAAKENADPNTPFSTDFLIAVHTLAMLDPDAVEPSIKTRLQQQAENFSLSANPAVIAMAIDLFETVKILGLAVSNPKIADLRKTVETQLYASIRHATTAGVPLEPMQTFLALRIGYALGVNYADASSILMRCEPYRVAGGWNSFILPRGDPATTAEALFIAREIGFEKYNPDKVANFLESFTTSDAATKNVRNLRFALRGLALLNRLPAERTMQEIQTAITTAILQSPKKQAAGLVFEYALLVYERGWKWPQELNALTVQVIQETANKNLRIDTLRNLAILEHVSNTDRVSREQLAQEIMQLRLTQSGFKPIANAAQADILSSFFAVQALETIESVELTDKPALEAFVQRCKQEYGYGYVCSSTSTQTQETEGSTLSVTYYALQLLHLLK